MGSPTTTARTEVVRKFQVHEHDTGSAPVQIALLTQRINGLAEHFQTHKSDLHSRQGLLQMVNRRRRLLEYLKRHDEASYRQVLQALDLRKGSHALSVPPLAGSNPKEPHTNATRYCHVPFDGSANRRSPDRAWDDPPRLRIARGQRPHHA